MCKEAIEKYGNTYTSNAVGCGPFELVKWTFGQGVLLKKFEEYFDADDIFIETITTRVIGEDTIAMLALKTGEVDVGYFEEYPVYKALTKLPGIIAMSEPSTSINWIHLNMKRKPFDDIRVRKALAYAIDRDEIATAVPILSQYSVLPKGMFGYTDDVTKYEYNPEKAKELLKEAGYPDGFDFELVYYTGPVKIWNSIVPIVQEQWRKIGVKVTLWAAEWAAMLDRRTVGNYDALVMQTGRFEPFQLLEPYFHSKNIPHPNNSFYDGIDELLERAKVQIEEEKILELLIEIQKKIAEDVPVIVLGTSSQMAAWRDNIEGMSIQMQPPKMIPAWRLKKN